MLRPIFQHIRFNAHHNIPDTTSLIAHHPQHPLPKSPPLTTVGE